MVVWLLALGLAAGNVEPPDETVSLDWEAPEGCPSAELVRSRIDALAADGARGAVAATVVVTRGDAGYVADLSVVGAEGHTKRQLEAATCDAVAEAAAVIVAVHRPPSPEAKDPPEEPSEQLVPSAETSDLSESTVTQEVTPPPNPPVVGTPVVAPARSVPRLRAAVSLEGSAAAGGLPPGVRAGAGAALLHPRVRAEVVGRYWIASDPAPGPRARVSLTSATVRIGPVFTVGAIELIPRAVFEAGAARGAGAGVTRRRTAWRPWIAAGISPALLWPVRPRFALGLAGELLGVVLRPTFEVGGVGTVFSAGGVSGGGGVIAEVRFP